MLKFTPDTNVLVLTGAGISAESGIRTFRDSGGLWENHRVEDVATPEAFNSNPVKVWEFYRQRYQDSISSKPNPAHFALVKLEQFLGDNFLLVTQNVDCLHIKAGSKRVLEMHGSLANCICTKCHSKLAIKDIDLTQPIPLCPFCNGILRPDIVWFGEIPHYLNIIDDALRKCSVFIIVGTSGVVYPAAGFVLTAKLMGAKTIAINLGKPDNLAYIDEFYQGKSGEILPGLVAMWIGE